MAVQRNRNSRKLFHAHRETTLTRDQRRGYNTGFSNFISHTLYRSVILLLLLQFLLYFIRTNNIIFSFLFLSLYMI